MGKNCIWPLLKTSSNSHSKPSFMNDLETLKTRQIVAENGKLGISSLHAWIKWFESLPYLSYRLDIKKLSVRKADRLLVGARKRKNGLHIQNCRGQGYDNGANMEDFGKRNMPGKRARRHFSQLSAFERDLINGMKTTCWSTCRVAGQVDRSECAVRNCWEQWTREGTHARKTGSGATRNTTRREDRRIVRQALVEPTVTRSTIRADVGVAIVPQTISRHLAEANLKSKRPFRALPLTPEHRQLCLQWCQARSMRNVTDWQKVVFRDQSRFVLGTDDNRVRVSRRPGERYNFPHTVLRHTTHTAGVMVWGP
ncbi:transposable element Tc1 transposase [Trichonephila clavipes]|nr:transposable element Tc1 transposase [Trichonephila clavipes]